MPSRYWLHVIALGACLGACVLPAVGQARADQKESVSQHTAETPTPDTDALKAIYDRIFWAEHSGHPNTYRAICEHPKDRDYADLCQQWRAAEAAKEAASWAEPQFWANVATILGLLVTIFLNIRATNAATRTVDAAHRTERAYIYVGVKTSGIKINNFLVTDGHMSPLATIERGKINLAFKNLGNTPAQLTRRHITPIVLDWSDRPIPIDPRKIGGIAFPVGNVVTSQEPFVEGRQWKDFDVSDEDILARRKALWVYGFVRYKDVFEVNHITGFALQYDPHGERFHVMGGDSRNYNRIESPESIPDHERRHSGN